MMKVAEEHAPKILQQDFVPVSKDLEDGREQVLKEWAARERRRRDYALELVNEKDEEKKKREEEDMRDDVEDDLKDIVLESIEHAAESSSMISDTLKSCCQHAFNKVAAGGDYIRSGFNYVTGRVKPLFDRLTGCVFGYVSSVSKDIQETFNNISLKDYFSWDALRWSGREVKGILGSAFSMASMGAFLSPEEEDNHYAAMTSAPAYVLAPPTFRPMM